MTESELEPRWWPDELGHPDAVGKQNDVQYAYFKEARRLLLLQSNQIAAYDAGEHEIHGISPLSDGGQATFTSNHGPIALSQFVRL